MNAAVMADALRAVVTATLETIRETGTAGCPEGILFAALQTQGCRLSQFTSLVSALEAAGKVRRDGHLLYAVEVAS